LDLEKRIQKHDCHRIVYTEVRIHIKDVVGELVERGGTGPLREQVDGPNEHLRRGTVGQRDLAGADERYNSGAGVQRARGVANDLQKREQHVVVDGS